MPAVKFAQISLRCDVAGCEFGPHGPTGNEFITEVLSPETLTIEDLQLLNLLLEKKPEDIPSDLVERLNTILDGRLECPTHGRTALGYGSLQEVTVTAEFTIAIEENNSEEMDGWPDGVMEI